MEIVIGKYTLESLTTGMYKDPFILYREYIQNSTDSIDEAFETDILVKGEESIKIIVNEIKKEIIIEDNGMGIKNLDAYKILTDIGNSKKRYSSHKGFRGIGRLGGISYCEKLVFETSYIGENCKTVVEFDSNRLKELLVPGNYEDYTMIDVIKEITTEKRELEIEKKHYFRVILRGVSLKHKLLEFDRVKAYLMQIAPVPFNGKFEFANSINNKLHDLHLESYDYNLYFGRSEDELIQIFKPYKNKFFADISKKIEDSIEDVKFKVIRNDYLDKIIAIVWYAKSHLLGTIIDENVKGLRVRKSGILIGDRFLLNDIFKEERFNGWMQGEVLVFDDKIIPNARRDDFEKNDEYLFLMKELKKVAGEINTEIRKVSEIRNQKKVVCEQIAFDDNRIDNEKTDDISVVNENIEENLEKLFDQFIEKDNENSILKQIEEILREELENKDKINKIVSKIRKIFV